MKRLALLAPVVLIALSCSEPRTPLGPDESAPAESPGALEPASASGDIRRLIRQLFPQPLSTIVAFHFRLIEQHVQFGQLGRARSSARLFVDIVLVLEDAGLVLDPRGALSADQGLARLISLILEFVGLNPQGTQIPAEALGPDGALQTCGPAGCTVVTGTRHAGVSIPPGAFDQTVLVAIARIPDPKGPLDTALDQYPLFYDITVLPDEEPDVLATVGLCVVDPPDPFAPDPDVVHRLRLAHPHPSGDGIEILPLAFASFLECAGAESLSARSKWPSWARALARPMLVRQAIRLLEPTRGWAGPGGLGGGASSFSPFAAVDSLSRNEENPGDRVPR